MRQRVASDIRYTVALGDDGPVVIDVKWHGRTNTRALIRKIHRAQAAYEKRPPIKPKGTKP